MSLSSGVAVAVAVAVATVVVVVAIGGGVRLCSSSANPAVPSSSCVLDLTF